MCHKCIIYQYMSLSHRENNTVGSIFLALGCWECHIVTGESSCFSLWSTSDYLDIFEEYQESHVSINTSWCSVPDQKFPSHKVRELLGCEKLGTGEEGWWGDWKWIKEIIGLVPIQTNSQIDFTVLLSVCCLAIGCRSLCNNLLIFCR